MSGKIVFDTVAAIGLLKGLPIPDAVAALLDTSKIYVSQITRIELYAYSKLSLYVRLTGPAFDVWVLTKSEPA